MVVLPKGSFKIVYTETLIGVKEVQNPEQFGRRSVYEVNQFLNVKWAEELGHCSEKLEQLCLSFEDFNQPLSDVFGVKLGGSPMTCQSSESAESLENERRSDNESGVVESDETRIASAMKDLRNTGWYWGSLTANEAREILHDAAEGTFLVRDSSQRDYLFTISAMTSAGPTNLRIVFKEGKFKLDSVVLIKPKLKQFDSVVHLVEHYMHLSRTGNKGSSQPLTPTNGTVQLLLTRPVYMATPSLQHLCRVAINRATRQVQRLPLPNRLKDYLTDYSYNV